MRLSVKQWLFFLVCSVLLLSLGSQLWVAWQLQDTMSEQISRHTELLAKDSISMLEKVHGHVETQSLSGSILQITPTLGLRLGEDATRISVVTPKRAQGVIVATDKVLKFDVLANDDEGFTLSQYSDSGSQTRVVKLAGESRISEQFFARFSLAALIITLLSVLVSFALAALLNRPMGKLQKGFEGLARGEWGTQIAESNALTPRESAQVIAGFNRMSERLRQLMKQNAILKEQQHTEELTDVIKGLAHSLRNPLNTLSLSLDALQSDAMDEAQQDVLFAQCRAKINAVDEQIKSLLWLSPSGLKRDETVNLGLLMQQIALSVGLAPSSVNVSSDVELMGNEQELTAILHPLVVNAIESGSPQSDIHIEIRNSGSSPVICVEDRGKGLSQAINESLFRPHTSDKTNGAGMGLFIAQRLIRSFYRGTIELNNREGGGVRACAQFFTEHEA